jgi:pantothenate kinase-related protein Tda10
MNALVRIDLKDPARFDPDAELIEAWRAVANAKLAEYRKQCWRLAGLVRQGAVPSQAAVDRLWEIATAHALVRSMGEDRVQAIISDALGAFAQ